MTRREPAAPRGRHDDGVVRPVRAMAGVGHEDPFPRPGPSGRCRFGQETFAGFRGNGRDAPISVVPPAGAPDNKRTLVQVKIVAAVRRRLAASNPSGCRTMDTLAANTILSAGRSHGHRSDTQRRGTSL